MNQIEMLSRQTHDAYNWTNKLINSVSYDKWNNIPSVIETSVSWQVGHLIISLYYHSIMVIVGHQRDILERIPMRSYDKLFTSGSPENATGKANPEELKNHLTFMQNRSFEVVDSLCLDDLQNPLHPTEIPHPIAKNKFEALDWNIKHTMWHCGQLGILVRIGGERFNFGLRREQS
jgi:hypothetical protein